MTTIPCAAARAVALPGLVSVLLAFGGCATDAPRPAAAGMPAVADAAGDCRARFHALDRRISTAGLRDAQSAPVPGFPYLRIDRFHAALQPPAEGPAFDAWVDRLRDLDRRARRWELANLASADAAPTTLDGCAAALRSADLKDPQRRRALLDTRVADAYQPWLRVLGLYPVTAWPFLLGVRDLHRETEVTFATPLEMLPVEGTLVRYRPAASVRPEGAKPVRPEGAKPVRPEGAKPDTLEPAAVAAILARSAANPLGIPDPAGDALEALFRTFAPEFEIDTVSDADIPGIPSHADRIPTVSGPPTVYTLPSYTRWQGRTLLQLNYVLWFPERPRESRLDLVGGNLDGITWRVTLGMDGRPLLFDSMHNCGCYYKAFPSARLTLRTRRRGLEEPLSVPQSAPAGHGPLVLRVSAGRHYVQRLYIDPPGADTVPSSRTYGFADYDELRSLPLPGGGRRSLFGTDGIVAGTGRAERWVFWPMGVPDPGAMRQWGHHAIAFVGRRHFDDPGLLETNFEAPPNAAGEAKTQQERHPDRDPGIAPLTTRFAQ